jgi:hypothetical protein
MSKLSSLKKLFSIRSKSTDTLTIQKNKKKKKEEENPDADDASEVKIEVQQQQPAAELKSSRKSLEEEESPVKKREFASIKTISPASPKPKPRNELDEPVGARSPRISRREIKQDHQDNTGPFLAVPNGRIHEEKSLPNDKLIQIPKRSHRKMMIKTMDIPANENTNGNIRTATAGQFATGKSAQTPEAKIVSKLREVRRRQMMKGHSSYDLTASGRWRYDAPKKIVLPKKVLVRIFSSVDSQDLLNCSLVCKAWNLAERDESIWKQLCENNLLSLKERVERVLGKVDPEMQALTKEVNFLPTWKRRYAIGVQKRKSIRKSQRAGQKLEVQFEDLLKENLIIDTKIPEFSQASLGISFTDSGPGEFTVTISYADQPMEMKYKVTDLLEMLVDGIEVIDDDYLIWSARNLLKYINKNNVGLKEPHDFGRDSLMSSNTSNPILSPEQGALASSNSSNSFELK